MTGSSVLANVAGSGSRALECEPVVTAVGEIDTATRQAMQRLYARCYGGSSPELFFGDLDAKDEVLLLYDGTTLAGFTSYQFYRQIVGQERIHVVYSGDTVVAPEYWGQQALAFAWIRRMGAYKRFHSSEPLYWLLLVKGHRTFRYLPAFSKVFYPHWDGRGGELKTLADRLAAEKFGKHYNREKGVVEFPESRGHLKSDIAIPKKREMSREDVRFFVQRNPHYRQGHELVCLCRLESANLKPLAQRLFADMHE